MRSGDPTRLQLKQLEPCAGGVPVLSTRRAPSSTSGSAQATPGGPSPTPPHWEAVGGDTCNVMACRNLLWHFSPCNPGLSHHWKHESARVAEDCSLPTAGLSGCRAHHKAPAAPQHVERNPTGYGAPGQQHRSATQQGPALAVHPGATCAHSGPCAHRGTQRPRRHTQSATPKAHTGTSKSAPGETCMRAGTR